jgi:histidine ammonia-lyase
MTTVRTHALESNALTIDPRREFTIADLFDVARQNRRLVLSNESRQRIEEGRRVIDDIIAANRTVYGVNTGFGDLSRVLIPSGQLAELQHNLIASHAAGAGARLPRDGVRATMALLANSLAKGHSGVRPLVVDTILAFLNEDVVPIVPSRGSVGASGDLAPLAHVALTLCGEGRVVLRDREIESSAAFAELGLVPISLESKEGLALINGTHLMAGLGALLVADSRRLLRAAELAAALSFDVMLGIEEVLDDRVHDLRGRIRQREVASRVRGAIRGSNLRSGRAPHVQDSYSLRCIPQVFGAVIEAMDYIENAIALELDAVSDNPLCFPESGDVISGGNFHGQPLVLPLDALAIALSELAAFSERRTFRLLSSPNGAGLPAFLSSKPGVKSGLMIVQYLAAALVAENQVLAHPAGVAVIPTSAGQEDFNSFGATAAFKAIEVLDKTRTIVAVELLCGAQALEFHRPARTSEPLEAVYALVRGISPADVEDRALTNDIQSISSAIEAGFLDDSVAEKQE